MFSVANWGWCAMIGGLVSALHHNKFSEVNEEHPETSGGLVSALHQLKSSEVNEEHPETSGGLVSA